MKNEGMRVWWEHVDVERNCQQIEQRNERWKQLDDREREENK